MSRSLDIAYNNIMSNQAPGVSEYEKSVALTQAQKSWIIALYNGATATSFEETEEYTTYLSPLVRQVLIDTVEEDVNLPHIVAGSYIFMLPQDMMFRTYESCLLTDDALTCEEDNTREVIVIPVTQDEFWRTRKNPFRGPNERKVLRLAYDISETLSLSSDTITYGAEGGSSSIVVNTNGDWVVESGGMTVDNPNKYVELVSKYPVTKYLLRYVRFPDPIILEDLPEGLTIDGFSTKRPCMLNPQVHERIVTEAANILKSYWG